MEGCLLDLAKNEVQSLVNLVKNEAQYLCCFNSYVENFEQRRNILSAKHKDVKRKFQKGKGVFSFKFEAQQWEHEADDIILIDTKIKKKLFFGWCSNCWWKYRRAKELAEKTQHIEKLLERCNSNIVAGRANVLDIKYLSSQGFIHFESRESKFQDLLKAIQDENCNMIGLQGLGGTGKTSMAKEVGHKLMKESKLIDKFIFLVVSQPPNFKKIRDELAKSLDLNSNEEKEEELSSTILSRITNMDQELLIVLDDVWVEFDLTEKLGIPFGHQQKGCNLLITTRSSHVCAKMGCQMIQLHTLTNEEALNLFKSHVGLNNSYRGFKGMPKKIVKHCGGVPVAIVALARALKNQPISVWKDALKTLEDCGLDQNLEEAYKCLKLSYDNLKHQKAKELLLISSLFPEDFEIPIKLLIKTGIGLGSFDENDRYHSIRSEVHRAIMELIHSSLFLNGEEECVKMHDLVREVVLWIGENDLQSLMDLKKPIKGNLRYRFWKTLKFPDEIDGNKLEYLSISFYEPEGLNVTDTFFKDMTSIKVLILSNGRRSPALSLMNSLQPLKSVQTLILVSLELGDISVLGNLLTLVTLCFNNCSIVELPKEFLKLKKLGSLEIEECIITMNNPFQVIEMCSQLEELTFVGNVYDKRGKNAISHDGSPLKLHRYCISSKDDLSYYSKKYDLSRCFRADELSNLVSHATLKQLVERAEVLSLDGEDGQRMWKSLVLDIFPIDKQGVMNNLIVLHLSSHTNMEYLIDTKDHDPSMSAFCDLAELHLSKMGVEDLCRGPPPSRFLEQLEILKLTGCYELKTILFNANYNLCHLKSMQLEDCPKLMSVFQPSTAPSLKELEELTITKCRALEYIIAGEHGDSDQKSYYDSLFPSLKELKLSRVPSFIGIVKEYQQLMSSSIHKQSPPFSRHNSRNLNQSLATRAFSWVQAYCSLNKLRPASKETNITIFEHRSLDHTNPLEFDTSIDRGAPSLTAQSLLLQSLKNVRKIKLLECHNVISLSTLSIATSTIALETLAILRCHKLKCITTHEGDAQVDRNNCSIFPTLEKLEIKDCEELEFLFVSAISVGLPKLKSLTINRVPKLKCVFGNYQKEQHSSNHYQNDELHFDLPDLETLDITYAPKINSLFAKNYSMVNLTATQKFDISIDRGAPSLTAQSLLLHSWKNVREITLMECHNLIFLSTLSIATSTIALETLTILRCHKLKCITTHEGDAQVDGNNCSIFPTLEKLEIKECEELEFLFASIISVGLQKLKSLTIEEMPKLKCVVGNHQKERHSSNQNQNDELHVDLPALETLYINDAPKVNSIFSKNYSTVNWTAIEKFDASIDKDVSSLTAQSLLLQSWKNVREMTLLECDNVISLSTLSIATSTIALETLTILKCHKLKCITTLEGDAQVDWNNCSIFPTLEKLEIKDCEELECLFVSRVSVGLPKLKSLTMVKVPKLKCVFENYQKEQHSSNQNQNDELHVDLPALETLYINYAPKINSIFAKNFSMVNWTTIEKFDASIDRGAHSLTSQSLLLQSLKNVRKITLWECHNIISLSTLSIATLTIALDTLTICGCHKLKCITTHEGDEVDRNNCSIFPTLEKMEIKDCEELEFLCVSAISVGLPKLKSLTINRVPKLKCVFGNYEMEQHSSNQDQNDKLHFDLPALESLYIKYASKINSMVNLTAIEEVHASTIGAPLFHVTLNLLKNIREIELVKCTNLISLTTLSVASIIVLEVLTIRACGQLKCIVGDAGDARSQINYNTIFPKLKWLEVSDCNALEYLFPAYAFRSPIYLESLKISKVPMLKYVFGRSQHNDNLNPHNQNFQTLIDFPALKDLSISYVPKLVSIYPKNYYMRGLYLRSVILKELPEFTTRSLNEFLVCWQTEQQETKVIEMCQKTLESLEVCDFKIEEIFDLTNMETAKKGDELQPLTSSLQDLKLLNLSELVNICLGPKCIIRFDSLRDLTIKACKKLRVIFSASTVRSLPMLKDLHISECEELVHIVEEDYETNADDHVRHEPCFSNLFEVSVSHCDKLKYLFSITISDILPKLYSLEIRNAYELERVLIKRDEMEEIVMKDVLPQLRHLTLSNLPNLMNVCRGINFQKEDYYTIVDNCPKFGTSTTQYKADLESGNSQVEEKAEERLSSHIGEEITQPSFTKVVEARAKGVSTSLNQASSSILPKSSDGVDHGDIKEASMVQNGNNSNVETISLTRREQESSYSKGQIQTKDQLTESQPISATPTTPFVTISQDEHLEGGIQIVEARGEEGSSILETSHPSSLTSKEDELVGKEVQTEKIVMEPHSQQETTGHDIHFHKEDEQEREDDVRLPNKSQSLAIDSSGSGNLVPKITHPINSLEGVNNEGINEASVVQNESKTNVTCHGDQANPSNITQIEQETSHSRGRLVESRDYTESDFIEDTKLSMPPFYTPIEIMPSFLETNNEASIVPGVQEIIHMMELEGFESLIFAKALETRPQLQLSTKDRSARVLCMSYRVLLDILNILTAKTPFTITEADKRLLTEHLKDAYLLGFDKDWIESVKTKVFDSGIHEVDSIQKVLKGLDNDLKNNEAMVEAVRDEEVEAARVVEVAQLEHANVMARHAHLLKERQDIIARRHRCWEIIAAKNRHFGF